MKQYEVKITREALADMNEIYDYIAFQLQSVDNAIGSKIDERLAQKFIDVYNQAK
jgi:plasmid stabilization system protein ParE